MVKKVLIVIVVVIVAVLLGATLFLPSGAVVERTAVVEASPETVFAKIADLHEWETWSPWVAKDRAMKLTYSEDPAEGVGANYSWLSETQGSGSMTIVRLEPPTLFEGSLDVEGAGTARSYFKLKDLGNGKTEVTWRMEVDLGNNPIGKMFGLAMGSMVGPDFEDGLSRLTQVVESGQGSQPLLQPSASPTPRE